MAENGLTKAANIVVTPREIDFVTRFSKNWQHLLDIMGIVRPIEKQPGQVLKSKVATVTLQDGNVGEGEKIPFSEGNIVEIPYAEITLNKFAKAVSIEAIATHGYDVAVQMTDDEFLAELQQGVTDKFYRYTKSGHLRGAAGTFKAALAKAQGDVRNRWKSMHRTITNIVGFVNINDVYEYLGSATIGPEVASEFGLNYIKNWMGFSALFLCADTEIPRGMIVSTPVENIVCYYINPGHSDFAKAGLAFVTDGETNLIGFKTVGDYTTDTTVNNALMGMVLFSEYIDGISVVDYGTVTYTAVVSTTGKNPAAEGWFVKDATTNEYYGTLDTAPASGVTYYERTVTPNV